MFQFNEINFNEKNVDLIIFLLFFIIFKYLNELFKFNLSSKITLIVGSLEKIINAFE